MRGRPAVMRLGVVAALPGEGRALARRRCAPGKTIDLGEQVLLTIAGIGPDRAARAARSLVEKGAEALLAWGLAAGLDPALAPGTLLIPEEILDEDGTRHATDAAWRAHLTGKWNGPVCSDPLVSMSAMLTTPEAKAACRQSTLAAAADMESAAVAAAAGERPFLALRVVADPAQRPLPRAAQAAVGENGGMRPLALTWNLLRRPGEIPELRRLQRSWTAARLTLEAVARSAGPRFGLDPAKVE